MATILLSASCAKVSPSEPEQRVGNALCVKVDGIASPASRAFAEATADDIHREGFGLFGIYGNGAVFVDATAAPDGDTFSPAGGPYYYPVDRAVSLYGVYPGSYRALYGSGKVSVRYAHNGAADVLVSRVPDVLNPDEPVSMTFIHILSRADVSVRTKGGEFIYDVKEVSMSFPGEGAYDCDGGEWGSISRTERMVFSAEGSRTSFSLIPCTPEIHAVWDVYKTTAGGRELIASCDRTVSTDRPLERGTVNSINITLSDGVTTELSLSVDVTPWEDGNAVSVFDE